MKRKIMQECPVYKNKNDIIDFWLYGKKDEKSCIGIAKVSMTEINVSVAYGYNVDEDDSFNLHQRNISFQSCTALFRKMLSLSSCEISA